MPEPADKPLRSRPARHHAEARLRQADADMRLGNANIGSRGKLQPAAQRMAVERGNQWHTQRRQTLEHAVPEADPGVAELVRRHRRPSLDVAACGKGLAGAGQDGDANIGIGLQFVARG